MACFGRWRESAVVQGITLLPSAAIPSTSFVLSGTPVIPFSSGNLVAQPITLAIVSRSPSPTQPANDGTFHVFSLRHHQDVMSVAFINVLSSYNCWYRYLQITWSIFKFCGLILSNLWFVIFCSNIIPNCNLNLSQSKHITMKNIQLTPFPWTKKYKLTTFLMEWSKWSGDHVSVMLTL